MQVVVLAPNGHPDGEWIAFLSKRGEKMQVQVIRTAGGESFQVTNTKQNIFDFEWSPDGKKIAFLQSEDKSDQEEERSEKYGGFVVEDAEYSVNQIWVTDFNPMNLHRMPLPGQMQDSIYKESITAKLLIDSVAFSINSFKWSPDGQKVAMSSINQIP